MAASRPPCSSVNHVVCHGIPSADQVLKNGDIINIDVAVTAMAGTATPAACTTSASQASQPANWWKPLRRHVGHPRSQAESHLGDVGFAIQTVAEKAGYSVVLDYCGHGIGMVYHEDRK
jgi:methionyl aminopeptidase